MRRMYDSITAADLPTDSELVAGYIDGRYRWTDADWSLFPGKVHVRIATRADTFDGHVLDVEVGDATPAQAVPWVQARRAVGADPSIYTSQSEWPAVRAAFAAAGEPEPHYWIANYGDGVTPRPAPPIPEGAVAFQYARDTQTGGHYDASVVADYWPGVDGGATIMATSEAQAIIAAVKADPALAADLYEALAPILQAKIVAPDVDTEKAEKAVEQRLGEMVQLILDNIAKIEANPPGAVTDNHIAAVVLQTVRAVFNGVAGNMPPPPP